MTSDDIATSSQQGLPEMISVRGFPAAAPYPRFSSPPAGRKYSESPVAQEGDRAVVPISKEGIGGVGAPCVTPTPSPATEDETCRENFLYVFKNEAFERSPALPEAGMRAP